MDELEGVAGGLWSAPHVDLQGAGESRVVADGEGEARSADGAEA
mgnify:CR=1 FL=1